MLAFEGSESCRDCAAAPADDQTRSRRGRGTPGGGYSSARSTLLARRVHPFEQAHATLPLRWSQLWYCIDLNYIDFLQLIHELVNHP